MTYTVICVLLTVLVSGFALLCGGAPERIVALIILIGSSLSTMVISPLSTRFQGTEIGVFAVDIAVLLAFMWLAMRANRFWPIGVVALQFVGIAGHVVSIVLPNIDPAVYGLITDTGIYPMLLLLAIGTGLHLYRLWTRGADRSWVISSPSSMKRQRSDGPID